VTWQRLRTLSLLTLAGVGAAMVDAGHVLRTSGSRRSGSAGYDRRRRTNERPASASKRGPDPSEGEQGQRPQPLPSHRPSNSRANPMGRRDRSATFWVPRRHNGANRDKTLTARCGLPARGCDICPLAHAT